MGTIRCQNKRESSRNAGNYNLPRYHLRTVTGSRTHSNSDSPLSSVPLPLDKTSCARHKNPPKTAIWNKWRKLINRGAPKYEVFELEIDTSY